jgi:hypothetical protein
MSTSNKIGIGGMFPTVTQTGEFDSSQAHHLAAFLLAIENINDKHDGIYDDLLPDHTLVSAIQAPAGTVQVGTAMANWASAFNNTGVFGFVSALPNDETVVADMIGVQSKIFQVNSVARDTRLSQYVYMPYRFMTVSVTSFDGLVMQSMLCDYFEARKLVIITDSGYDSRGTVNELLDESSCTFDVLETIEIRVMADYEWVLKDAMATGARYFALVLYEPGMAAGFLTHAHEEGAFNDDSVIVITEKMATDIFDHFSPSADVAAIMKGVFSVEYWPEYSVQNSPFGMDFVSRFAAQPSTTGSIVNGKHVCNDAMDDNGQFYLYRAQNNASLCTGLDFTHYAHHIEEQLYMPLTYDAVLLLAHTIHTALEYDVSLTDTDAIVELIVANITTFEGVSGPIKIDDGNGDFENFARGTREEGNHYLFTNFDEAEYEAGNHSMVTVGNYSYYDEVAEFATCSPALMAVKPCYDPVFRTGLADITPDMPPPVYETFSVGVSATLTFFSALNLVTLLLFAVVTIKYRKVQAIKASQPVMLFTILFGGALALIRGIMGLIPASDGDCNARVFIGHLAFAVMFGSLFVKSWRVHVLVNSRALKRIKFTAGQAFTLLCAIVGAALVYLIILDVVAKPHLSYASEIIANQEYLTPRCSFEFSQFQTVLMAIEAVFMLFSFRICWNIRSVPDAFNESMSIAQAMMFTILVGGLIIPIVFLFGLDPLITEFLTSIGFEIASLVVLWTLFGPKAMNLLNLGGPSSILARISDKNKIVPVDHDGSVRKGGDAASIAAAAAIFKGMKLRDRVQLCHVEIAKWQGLLVQQMQCHSDGDSGSASAGSAASENQGGDLIGGSSLHGSATNTSYAAVTQDVGGMPSSPGSKYKPIIGERDCDRSSAVAEFNVEELG